MKAASNFPLKEPRVSIEGRQRRNTSRVKLLENTDLPSTAGPQHTSHEWPLVLAFHFVQLHSSQHRNKIKDTLCLEYILENIRSISLRPKAASDRSATLNFAAGADILASSNLRK